MGFLLENVITVLRKKIMTESPQEWDGQDDLLRSSSAVFQQFHVQWQKTHVDWSCLGSGIQVGKFWHMPLA